MGGYVRQRRRPAASSRIWKPAACCSRPGRITHTYPFCWRCDTPLLYYARPTWYIRTSQFKDRLVELNEQINWYPGHIKNGRFGNWLANNVDWALGRERYWGTPLPVWECENCHHQDCIGSVAELSRAGRARPDRAWICTARMWMRSSFPCPECGGTMQRVPELIDVWFDSGSMPVAQWHYPFENQEDFQAPVPGRLHLRGGRPDARLVLLAACHQHLAVRPGVLSRM